MNRKRAGIVAVTVAAGVAAAVAVVIVNGSASAAVGVELPLIAQRMPIAAGQGGIESRVAIVNPDNVGAAAITNASIRFTVPEGVTVYHTMIVQQFDPAEATAGVGRQQTCAAVNAITFDCEFVSGGASFGNVYTFGQQQPINGLPVLTASLNSSGTIGSTRVLFAPRVFTFDYRTRSDQVVIVS